MQAKDIEPGAVLLLKRARQEAYDFPRATVEVVNIQERKGYKVPWIVARSERPEGGLLYFTPSDFARAVRL
jgi:hypothetical protein